MTSPNYPLLFFALLPCLASVSLIVQPTLWPGVLLLDIGMVFLALYDLTTFPRRKIFRIERECSTTLSLNEMHHVVLLIENRSNRSWTVEVREDQLAVFTVTPDQVALQIPARSRAKLDFRVVPEARGSYTLEFVYVRLRSQLQLWQRIWNYPVRTDIQVYPNLKQIGRYAFYARTNRLNLLGVRRSRKPGNDNEFERLREYTQDDSYKNIDWRATARRQKLVVKDFQNNHNQRVLIMLDCGRLMVNQSAGLSLLDHAINATLLLSHVILANHDQVGLVAFSDQIHQWLPLGSGPQQQRRFIQALHNLFPSLVESRYDQAFYHVNTVCRKRTLVLFITQLIDEVSAKFIQTQLGLLVGRHLPMIVWMRDHALFNAFNRWAHHPEPNELADSEFYDAAAAASILDWRQRTLIGLQLQNILTVDAAPEELVAPMINEYLQIKARHLL